MPPKLPVAPRHLSLAARRLWAAILAEYQLEPHHRAILAKALEAWDRAEQARRILDKDGIIVETRLGERKAHAAVAIERDSRAAFLAGMRQLALDYDPADAKARAGNARASRWSA